MGRRSPRPPRSPSGARSRRRHDNASSAPTIIGVLTVHPDGYGFVTPRGTPAGDRTRDIYIGPRSMDTAMHGDTVKVLVRHASQGNRRRGRIIEIVERASTTIVGVYAGGAVNPIEQRHSHRILIPPEVRGDARDEDIVIAHITRFPFAARDDSPRHSRTRAPRTQVVGEAEGKIVAVLGRPDDPATDLPLIRHEFQLPERFPEPVLAEAHQLPTTVLAEDCAGREDLRALPLCTIDGETAKDFDDAVFVERNGDEYRLLVAIADVATYAPLGGTLATEARARSTSVYFPGAVIPMFPEALSNGIASLNPDANRLALAVDMRFTADGARTDDDARVFPAVMRSRARLTYTQVAKYLDMGKRTFDYPGEHLAAMRDLAHCLSRRRVARGSLDLDIPEPVIILDDAVNSAGHIVDIRRSPRTDAHRLIEEFMLAANEAVAEFVLARDIPAIFRIHEAPPADDVETLLATVKRMGFHSSGKTQKRRSRARTPRHAAHIFDALLRWADKRDDRDIIHMLVLRSLTQASYAPKCEGHFGLASPRYLHFTSPIRRYPDFFVHHMLWRYWEHRGEFARPAPAHGKARRFTPHPGDDAEHASVQERHAEDAERAMHKLKAARFMHARIGTAYDGLVMGIIPAGLFVRLERPFVETFVATEHLPPDDYWFDEHPPRLKGRSTGRAYTLGQRLRVRVIGASVTRRQIECELAA